MAEWFVKHATTNCRSYPMQSQPFESDHRILVLDTLFPTRKTLKKTFHKTQRDKKHHDLGRLRDDPSIHGSYSGTLDSLLRCQQEPQTPDQAEELQTNVIHQASTVTIPPRESNVLKKPWSDEGYQDLLNQYHKKNDPVKKKALSYDVRKAHSNLKNAYFTSYANQLNGACDQRDTEEEFRLMKRYRSLSRVERPMIQTKKLKEHFSAHFAARPNSPQPELEHPENYPHLFPPDDLPVIDTNPPERAERLDS